MDKEPKEDEDILAFKRVFNSEDGERILKRIKRMAYYDDYSLPIDISNESTRYLFMARKLVNFIVTMRDASPYQEVEYADIPEIENEL